MLSNEIYEGLSRAGSTEIAHYVYNMDRVEQLLALLNRGFLSEKIYLTKKDKKPSERKITTLDRVLVDIYIDKKKKHMCFIESQNYGNNTGFYWISKLNTAPFEGNMITGIKQYGEKLTWFPVIYLGVSNIKNDIPFYIEAIARAIRGKDQEQWNANKSIYAGLTLRMLDKLDKKRN